MSFKALAVLQGLFYFSTELTNHLLRGVESVSVNVNVGIDIYQHKRRCINENFSTDLYMYSLPVRSNV